MRPSQIFMYGPAHHPATTPFTSGAINPLLPPAREKPPVLWPAHHPHLHHALALDADIAPLPDHKSFLVPQTLVAILTDVDLAGQTVAFHAGGLRGK